MLKKNILDLNEMQEKVSKYQKEIESLMIEKTIAETTHRENLSRKDEKMQELLQKINKLEENLKKNEKSLKKSSREEILPDYKQLYESLKQEVFILLKNYYLIITA